MDMPASLLDESIDLAEAEARALSGRLRREKRLEDAIKDILLDAFACIGDRQPDVIARIDLRRLGIFALFDAAIARRNDEVAPSLHCIACIDRNVEDRVVQLVQVYKS